MTSESPNHETRVTPPLLSRALLAFSLIVAGVGLASLVREIAVDHDATVEARKDELFRDQIFRDKASEIAARDPVAEANTAMTDNDFSHMAGWVGDAGFVPSGYSEYTIGNNRFHYDLIDHWITVGNIFRRNRVTDAQAGGNIGWRSFENFWDGHYVPRADRGMAMSVLEQTKVLSG